MTQKEKDIQWMQRALQEAENAYTEQEVPIGSVVVLKDKIIARGYNQTEQLNDCTAHAEMIALTSAFHYLGSKYLPEATLYVTVEPCLMLSGALYWSKIARIVYGAADPKNGYQKTTQSASPFHPKTKISAGILEKECQSLMKRFFEKKR
ncbi:MAG TPA: nucleoside deaminase [Chitinophagaceae bacterium]|nr:nucleoside deaminase [Chitinophagaceae bacterium]